MQQLKRLSLCFLVLGANVALGQPEQLGQDAVSATAGCILTPCASGCPLRCTAACPNQNCAGGECGDPDCKVFCGGGTCDLGCGASRCNAICVGNNLCQPVCGGSPCNIGCSPCQTPSCPEFCALLVCPLNNCDPVCGDPACKPLCGGGLCQSGCPDECTLICPQNICSPACGDPSCKVVCGGGPCDHDCPNACDSELCSLSGLCNPNCGGDRCNLGCALSGGGVCGPGCSAENECSAILCPLNALCNTECGGDPCNIGCGVRDAGPCSAGCPSECIPLLCPLNTCSPTCGDPNCRRVCGGDPCNAGCPGECSIAICPSNYCSAACAPGPECKVLCGGDPCAPGCPGFCEPACVPFGGGACGAGCPNENGCDPLICGDLVSRCRTECGGDPCGVGCRPLVDDGGPCGAGCPNAESCSPLLCPGKALCDPECGGDSCNRGCKLLGRGTGPCGDGGCPTECSPLICPLKNLCSLGCPNNEDCNNNFLSDRCEISAHKALYRYDTLWTGACGDCNLNFIPDQCDIDSGFSKDINLNGVPDECCLIPADSIEGDIVSFLTGESTCLDSITIDGETDPSTAIGSRATAGEFVTTVDAAVSVDSIRLINGAVLAVTGAVDEDLTVLGGGISVSGQIGNPSGVSRVWVANNRVIDATPGQVLIDAGGEYLKDPAATTASSASLLAGELVINSGSAESLRNGGLFELTDTMSATIGGDLLLNGVAVDLVAELSEGAAARSALQGGQTPPSLRLKSGADTSSSNAARASGVTGVHRLTVGGNFVMLKEAEVCVGCDFIAGAQQPIVSLAGDFDNQSFAPELFDWGNGILRLSGSAVAAASSPVGQVFEVGGIDMGTTSDGLTANFAIGTLEVGPTSVVAFVNDIANTAGLGECTEALYVDRLVLSNGSTVTLDNVRVYYTELEDDGATINLLGGCAQLVSLCAASAPLPDVIGVKNRSLSFTAGDVGQQQTIRVSWDAMPNWPGGHDLLVGQQKWLMAPFQVCENSGDGLAKTPPDCGPAPGQPQKWFWAARLDCNQAAAFYSDMTLLMDYCSVSGEACTSDANCAAGTCGVDGVIHIFDQGIVPTKNTNQQAAYSVQVIAEACMITEGNFSAALPLTQPIWGDIGDGTGCPMAPPNGVAGLVPDVTSALAKFSNAQCAPKKTRVDVEPAGLDMLVNITDVLQLLNAFSSGSASYGFPAGPACAAGG